MPPKLATFFSFSELNAGQKSTLEDLRRYLSQHPLDSVVYVCSAMNCLLRMWERGMPSIKMHEDLIEEFFPPGTAAEFISAGRGGDPRRVVFHRQQLLLVAKEAILNCGPDGVDPLREPYIGKLGTAFLMANDFLTFGFPEANTNDQEILQTLAEFIPIMEYSGRNSFRHKAMRSYRMLGEISDDVRTSPGFVDIGSLFEETTGQPVYEYQGLCFAILSKYLAISVDSFKTDNNSFFLGKSWFQSMQVPFDRIEQFLNDVAGSAQTVKESFTLRNLGNSDFTPFRDKPLFRTGDTVFAIDPGFLAEKLESGVFWRVHNSMQSGTERKVLHSTWGKLFETYCQRLLQNCVDDKLNVFYPSPQYEQSGNEAIDGLMICGSTAILLEFKGSTFTAKAKYSGDLAALESEIEKKLVETNDEAKGVRQLANAVFQLFGRETQRGLKSIDLSRVKTIYSVLVTRDDIGGALLINMYLNRKFRRMVNPKRVRGVITPLFVLSAEGLEHIATYLKEARLSDILEARWRGDQLLTSSFMLVDNPVIEAFGERENQYLYKDYDDFIKRHVSSLFRKQSSE